MRWLWEAFKLEAKKIISYRVDFWMQFLVTAIAEFLIAFYLWKNIYTKNAAQTIAGYDFRKMLMYYLFVPFLMRIVRSQDDFSTSREIYDGSINRYLIYPVSFMQYKFLQKWTFSFLSSLQMLLALLVIQIFVPLHLQIQNVLMGILCAYAAFSVYFLLNFAMEIVAFWVDTVWSLGVMLRFIALFLGGGFVPVNLFPQAVQKILYLTPFPYTIYEPIRIMLGEGGMQATLTTFGISVAWIIPIYIIVQWELKKGLEQYTGVGI